MILYLIRHAEAEDIGTGGITRDFDRPLTARGRDDSHALAESFVHKHFDIDAITASPLVRAHQTAVEFLSVLAPGLRVVTCDELAIDRMKPAKLSEFLSNLPASGERVPSREQKSVAAFGHMPDLAAYLEWLLDAAPGTIKIAKAGAACLRFKGDVEKSAGVLDWMVTPEWL